MRDSLTYLAVLVGAVLAVFVLWGLGQLLSVGDLPRWLGAEVTFSPHDALDAVKPLFLGTLALAIPAALIKPSQRGADPRLVAFTSWSMAATMLIAAIALVVAGFGTMGATSRDVPTVAVTIVFAVLTAICACGTMAIEPDRLLVVMGMRYRSDVRRRCRDEIHGNVEIARRPAGRRRVAMAGPRAWTMWIIVPSVVLTVSLVVVQGAQTERLAASHLVVAMALIVVLVTMSAAGSVWNSTLALTARMRRDRWARLLRWIVAAVCTLTFVSSAVVVGLSGPWFLAAGIIIGWCGPAVTLAILGRLSGRVGRRLACIRIGALRRQIARLDRADALLPDRYAIAPTDRCACGAAWRSEPAPAQAGPVGSPR